MRPPVGIAVEGDLDAVVFRRVVEHAGASVVRVVGRKGKGHLRNLAPGLLRESEPWPWLVLVDLDQDACPATLVDAWAGGSDHRHRLRVAVREIEAWLLADREAVANLLALALPRITELPEALDDPKGQMLELARQSPRKDLRAKMLPLPDGGRSQGRGYNATLIQFVSEGSWRPGVAAERAPSLRRCIERDSALVATFRGEVRERPAPAYS